MDNMGNISRKEAEAFCANVLKELKLDDWHMEWTDVYPSICIRERKLLLFAVPDIRFRIYRGYPWQAKELILHEITHILTPDTVHGEAFYSEYIKLLTEFMVMNPL